METLLNLAQIRSFHVGGRVVAIEGQPLLEIDLPQQPNLYVVDPNGDFDVERTSSGQRRAAS